MRNTTLPLATLLFLLGSSLAFSDKSEAKLMEKNHTEATILEGGIRRTILIKKDSTLSAKSTAPSTKQGVILSFWDDNSVSVGDLERRYGLKLQEKLMIGYYIFENISDKSDMKVVEAIIKDENHIKTVKPNWQKNNIPR